MPSTDRKLELKAKASVAQTGSQPFVYAEGLIALLVTTDLIWGNSCFNKLNPLTPELNSSAQRCLTRFFTGDFFS
jgi:hypothetical protein